MPIVNPALNSQAFACIHNAIECRMSTVPVLYSHNNPTKIGWPISYYVLDESQESQHVFHAPQTGWRALVIVEKDIILAGVSKIEQAYFYVGLKVGKYPEYFLKACNYAQRKFAASELYFEPAILFIPTKREHYLWLKGQVDYFIKIPIHHARPRFQTLSKIKVGKVLVRKIESGGELSPVSS